MSLTPETLTRHELNGLPVRVADAPNPDLVGIGGHVVVETQGTLHVDDGARVRQVPKRGTTFEFRLPASGEPGDVEGITGEQAGDGPACTDEHPGDGPACTEEHPGARPACTDEAAGEREPPGSASERERETAGVRPGQSGSTREGSAATAGDRPTADREDVVYVTVDGTRLLSRPAHRTENHGDSKWR